MVFAVWESERNSANDSLLDSLTVGEVLIPNCAKDTFLAIDEIGNWDDEHTWIFNAPSLWHRRNNISCVHLKYLLQEVNK